MGRDRRNVSKLTDGLGGGLGGVADQLSAILDSIQPADVDRVFGRVSAAFETISDAASGLQGVIAGVGLSIAGLGARSVLGPLGGIVPVISPITGVLGGLVLGSDEGREALVNLGREAAKFATGTGSQLLAAASRLTDNLSRGLASALEDVGSAVIDAADTLGPVLGEAMDDLGPPIGELLEALGELVEAVLPKLADIAGGVLPPIFDVLGTGIGIAADAVGLLADNLWLAVPAIGAFVAVRFGDSIRGSLTASVQPFGVSASSARPSLGSPPRRACRSSRRFGAWRGRAAASCAGSCPVWAGSTSP